MEIEECTSDSCEIHDFLPEKSESRFDAISDEVWRVGKKIAITGIVVSSAPIVLPPLMFFSTLGFVFAVPFGVAFVGYACTEKVMSSLFPRLDLKPEDYQPLDWLVVPGGDGEMKALEDKLVVDEKRHEGIEDTHEEETVTEEKNGEEGDENEETQENVGGEIEEKIDVGEVGNVEEGEKQGEIKIVEEENVVDQEKKGNGAIVEDSAVVVVLIEDDGQDGGFENRETIAEKKNLEEGDGGEKTQEKVEGKIEVVRDEGKVDIVEGGEYDTDKEKEENETMFVVLSDNGGQGTSFENGKNQGSQPAASLEGGVASVQYSSALGFSPAIEQPYLETSDTQSTDSVKHPVSSNGTESKLKVLSEAEDLYNEEKIWKQIDAMRTIVGYKATVNASFVEEIKALYMFTGVEPPVSFKDPPDLVEVTDKLIFLKSVVGVK